MSAQAEPEFEQQGTGENYYVTELRIEVLSLAPDAATAEQEASQSTYNWRDWRVCELGKAKPCPEGQLRYT